ncbi:MAG TPA: hypothetical protein ENN22_14295 [bacterium]|nr:hypothetical protein [bacterium]
MGQQQLLLIVLSVLIAGVSVALGFTIFAATAASANLDAVIDDLLQLASRAQLYYHQPELNGAGNSFVNISMKDISSEAVNSNGVYSIKTAGSARQVVLQGIGTRDGDGDGTNCTAFIEVFADSVAITIANR